MTVIIELRARFDEEANIELANKLQEAGAHVMYGVFGFKTHAKLVMVVRREEKGLRRYCHLGTGNYHAKTARLYTDYGLMTADEADRRGHPRDIPAAHRTDARAALAQAPARAVQPASGALARRSTARPTMRAPASRRASSPSSTRSPSRPSSRPCTAPRAPACDIDLIVRGVCCLRPGVPGVSERITRALHRRPLSRAFPRLSLRECGRARGLLRAAPTGWTGISSAESRSRFRWRPRSFKRA